MRLRPRRFYYGWWVAAAASSIEFANAATAIGILTVFVLPMSQEFGWNRTEVAGATSLGAVLGATLAPFSGRLVDRFGARVILVAGGLVVVLGCLYLSTAQALLGFYAAFTMIRIADQGLIKIGASVTAGKWFLRYRGRATGLVFFASSGGIIVMAPIVQLVITHWDWRAAWVVLAGVMFFVGVIPSALIIRRQPEDLGLTIDGGTPVGESTDPTRQDRDEREWPLSEVTRTPAFWLILTSLFLVSTATSGIGYGGQVVLTVSGPGHRPGVFRQFRRGNRNGPDSPTGHHTLGLAGRLGGIGRSDVLRGGNSLSADYSPATRGPGADH